MTINNELKLNIGEINQSNLNDKIIKKYNKVRFIKRVESFLISLDIYRESYNYYYYYNMLNNVYMKINCGDFNKDFANIDLQKKYMNL
jgi:hypothetical protein